MLNLEKIGKKISVKRKELKITQNELAEMLFVTHQAVSKWENGKSIPTVDLLYELTKILHISIDYLLEDSDILDNDYETQFKQYPRASVIKKFLELPDPNEEIEQIFYLLTKPERRMIIDLLINNKTSVTVESLWYMLSSKEREYLLTVILTCKFDYDLNKIIHQLNDTELRITYKSKDSGSYPYPLTLNKGVIM